MNFAENPNNQKEKTNLTPENQVPVPEHLPAEAVEMISDDEAREIVGSDAKRIQEIQQELKSGVSPEPVGDTPDVVPVDSKEDRLRRLARAAELTAADTFYEGASDDFLSRLGLPEKKHMAMYEKMIEQDDHQLIWNHDLTEKQKNWYVAHKADAEAKLNEMNLARRMVRQRIIDGIEKQQYQQQNGYGIVDWVKGRFQKWRLGRQLNGFDANVEGYKQKTLQENSEFYK